MQDEHVEWVKANAVKFRSVDPADTDFSDLQKLKELIGDAQIVQLGEQSHGDGTCFETKIRLIKFLHQEMGFDVLAFESGIYDCRKAWQKFEAGKKGYGAASSGVFGIWTSSKQTASLWEYLEEKSQTESPLELAGFDCQFTALASSLFLIKDVKAFAANHKLTSLNKKAFGQFCQQLNDFRKGEPEGDKADFDGAIQKLIIEITAKIENDANLDTESTEELSFWLQNFKSIKAHADNRWGNDSSPMEGVADRDEQMAKNLIWMASTQFPKRKIIVWAASFHIMRNPPEIEVPSGSIDYSEVVQMGHRVHEELGRRVFTVGFTAYQGKAGAFHRPKFDIGKAPAGTLEDIFFRSKIENGFLALNSKDKNGKWLNEKMFSRPLGYGWMKANWGRHFDAMIFNQTVKPSTAR
ncbi:MAG: erythromycin esterase family protein [Mariniblastus sp.]